MKRVVIASASAALLYASTARAYVRTRAQDSGVTLEWKNATQKISPTSNGSLDMSNSQISAVVNRSIQNWLTVVSGCSFFTITLGDAIDSETASDGVNVVKFRTTTWGRPAEGTEPAMSYDAAAAALTTTSYDVCPASSPNCADAGKLVDADIEVNNVNFTFVAEPSSMAARPGTSIADLENTLTHELGHFQGLDHTCTLFTSSNETDENGTPVPHCDDLAALPDNERNAIEAATMYASATAGETKKRTPEQDDIAGICAIYPVDDAPTGSSGSTLTDTGSSGTSSTATGCAYSPNSSASPLLALPLAALYAWRRRRRERIA